MPPQVWAEEAERAARLERRRRVMHFRRRRRDLLEDCVAGLVLMIFAIVLTPGLGMLALLEIPVGLAVIGSVVAERRIRKRRAEGGAKARPRPQRRPRG
ncbi:MAG TPA: hypothetical protein VG294_12745 [Solirubrobacteraceae bacterium]|nr:hypothetical protein [Solirubrobacteraceae bacterium]